jgi:PleD family two-component response regulator
LKKKSVKSGGGACCLDEASGLYSREHFLTVLGQELARLDRWERPLSLAFLDFPALDVELWPRLGRLLKASLRSIDLAARWSEERVGALLPDAGAARCRRWLADLSDDLARAAWPLPLRFGLALARPLEGRRPEEMLKLAAMNLAAVNLGAGELRAPARADDPATAIAADERDLLFAGFKILENGLKA